MILLIDFILALITTFMVVFFGGLVNGWIDFYIPILLELVFFIAYIGLSFLFLFAFAIPVKRKTEFNQKKSKVYCFVMEYFFEFLNNLANLKICIENKEKMPKNKRFMLCANHLSKFDSMILNDKFKGYDIAWIGKKSLFKMPLISNYIYKSNFLMLDREDLRQGLRVTQQAIKYIEEDQCSIGVFPEGTRNDTKEDLLPLKSGSFKIALHTKVDIVVMSIANTNQIHKRWPRRTKVYFRICDVIKYDDYKDLTTNELCEKVEEIMRTNIRDLKEKIK